jgi:hypothetical protein
VFRPKQARRPKRMLPRFLACFAQTGCMLSEAVKVFANETREIIRRFLFQRLSFPQCVAALDDALADLTLRATPEQLDSVHDLVLANNRLVMEEMERRGLQQNRSTHF